MSDVLRRLRRTTGLRRLFAEFDPIEPRRLIYPVFVKEGLSGAEPIPSMPGQARLGLDLLPSLAHKALERGLGGLLVFGLPIRKDALGSAACDPGGVVSQCVHILKSSAPDLPVWTDVCLCGATDHGHCGVLVDGGLDHEATCERLAAIATVHARAGADAVAPSSMVDGQVRAIRLALDAAGHGETAVIGYSAKFASAYYGPFREAAGSTPSFGDRKAYQHDPANLRHARREVLQDEAEGADAVMVKPGMAYLDIVRMAREATDLPLVAYQVSGEYSMIKAAAERGWLDERAAVAETLLAFRRAGADLVISYFALQGFGTDA